MPRRTRPTGWFPFVLLIGALLTAAPWGPAARAADGSGASASAATPDGLSPADEKLFAEVLARVRADYVTPVDEHKLLEAALRGMVESLDTHSTFLDTSEFQDMQVTTSGSYAGIGVEVEPARDGVRIVRRMPGSPAARAGIHSGDLITGIDGVPIKPTDVDAAIDRMRGPDGSSIRLAIRRAGIAEPLHFELKRAHVKLLTVEAERLTPQYGYLRISSFTDGTGDELERAVRRLERAGPRPLQGFILDLRNNPGGVLDSAIQVADDFLDHGTIVSAQGRAPDATFRIEAHPGDITHGAHLIVLVNGGSASAAEILAAALHDNGRAELIGRRTYGKGTVQSIMPLGHGAALKLTTSRYFTPTGVSINGIGIVPDLVLRGPEALPADLDTDAEPAAGAISAAAARAGAPGRVAAVPQRGAASGADSAALQPTLAERDAAVGIALNLLSAHAEHLVGRVPESSAR